MAINLILFGFIVYTALIVVPSIWEELTTEGQNPQNLRRKRFIRVPFFQKAPNKKRIRKNQCVQYVKYMACNFVVQKADKEARTPDLLITNELLYQLSYIGLKNYELNSIFILTTSP